MGKKLASYLVLLVAGALMIYNGASSLSERHAHRLLGAKHEGMSTGDPSDESRKSSVSW